jgi:hypothetical protein
MLRVNCGWCQILLGFKPGDPHEEGALSHGMCRDCWAKNSAGIDPTPEMAQEWAALDASLRQAVDNGRQAC